MIKIILQCEIIQWWCKQKKTTQSTALDFKSTAQLPPSSTFTSQFKVVFEVDSTCYRSVQQIVSF